MRTKSVTVRLPEWLVKTIEEAAKDTYGNNKTYIIEGILLNEAVGKKPHEIYISAKDGHRQYLDYCRTSYTKQ